MLVGSKMEIEGKMKEEYKDKTKGQLINKLVVLRQRIAELEASENERKQAEEKLMKKTEELERFNKLAVGRELKMIELKKEINALSEQLEREPRYKIVGES